MAVITPPWYSLQEADLVSFVTQLETRVGGRGPTDHLCPLEETKQITCESLLHMCAFLGSPPRLNPARIQGHCCWQGCILPLGSQACRASFHGWAVSWLRWREGDGLLPATPASARHSAHTQTSRAGFIGDGAPPQLLDMAREAQASQVCLCLRCCRRVHLCNPWPPARFFCVLLGIHKQRREMGKCQTKVSCHEGIASMKLIQELILKTEREGGRDSRNLLSLLRARILPHCMSVWALVMAIYKHQ